MIYKHRNCHNKFSFQVVKNYKQTKLTFNIYCQKHAEISMPFNIMFETKSNSLLWSTIIYKQNIIKDNMLGIKRYFELKKYISYNI